MSKEAIEEIIAKLKRSKIPDHSEGIVQVLQYLINEKEMLENKLETMAKNILLDLNEIWSDLIDLKRFYLAMRITHCKNCTGIVIFDWEPPIIMKELNNGTARICEKHQKELDEFIRKYCSD